jgi:hypothetical protein
MIVIEWLEMSSYMKISIFMNQNSNAIGFVIYIESNSYVYGFSSNRNNPSLNRRTVDGYLIQNILISRYKYFNIIGRIFKEIKYPF